MTIRYCNVDIRFAEQCAALEREAFPHTDPADLMSIADVESCANVFSDGFFLAVERDRVVGQSAGIFTDFDVSQPQHSLREVVGANYCGNHDPRGDWYYGTDIVVHPDFRRRGIGRHFYDLRKKLVQAHRKRGIIAGGHMVGFDKHKHALTAAEYIERVRTGNLYDATLSFQISNGFRLVGAIANYLRDEATDNWAALIVWENPDFVDATLPRDRA